METLDNLAAPRLITRPTGGRWWLFDDGTQLPYISGGSGDTDDLEDADDDQDEDGSDDGEEFDQDRARRAISKKNRENANLRRRLKEAEADQEELAKIRDKDKSSGERLTETTTKLGQAEMTVARLEVALEKGLTLAQANRLVGATKDELLEDADDYLTELGDRTSDDDSDESTKKRAPRRPKEKVRRSGAGTTDTDDDGEDDPRALAANIRRRF